MNGHGNVHFSVFNRVAVLQIPKNGSTSLRSCQLAQIDLPKYIKYKSNFDRTLIFVNCPMKRFKTAYRFMTDKSRYQSEVPRGDYKAFVDWVIDGGYEDEHLLPQHMFVSHCDGELHKLENLNKVMEPILGHKMPRLNSCSRPAKITDYRNDDIMSLYESDIGLYDAAR